MDVVDYLDSHNPYFNRWFSAIQSEKKEGKSYAVTILILIDGFLQLIMQREKANQIVCHNPYFNRWFSAISEIQFNELSIDESQSLF